MKKILTSAILAAAVSAVPFVAGAANPTGQPNQKPIASQSDQNKDKAKDADKAKETKAKSKDKSKMKSSKAKDTDKEKKTEK